MYSEIVNTAIEEEDFRDPKLIHNFMSPMRLDTHANEIQS